MEEKSSLEEQTSLSGAVWALRQVRWVPWGLLSAVVTWTMMMFAAMFGPAALFVLTVLSFLVTGFLLVGDKISPARAQLQLDGQMLRVRGLTGSLPKWTANDFSLGALYVRVEQGGSVYGWQTFALLLMDRHRTLLLDGLVCSKDELDTVVEALQEAVTRAKARQGAGAKEIPAALRAIRKPERI